MRKGYQSYKRRSPRDTSNGLLALGRRRHIRGTDLNAQKSYEVKKRARTNHVHESPSEDSTPLLRNMRIRKGVRVVIRRHVRRVEHCAQVHGTG